jgi:very-short-patch-repair endonuclease
MRDDTDVSRAIQRERCLHTLAAKQDGVVTHRQLLALGFSSWAIDWRLKTGRLFRIHRGVYALGRLELSRQGQFRAAVLAIGDDSHLAGFAAAAHWGFWKGAATPIDIVVPRKVRPRKGLRVHCVAELPSTATTVHLGLPLTTVERTIHDLAATMYSQRHFRRVVHEAEALKLTDPDRLRLEIARSPGRPGGPRLLAEIADGPKPTRSGAEDDMVALLRRHDFPPFHTNVRPPGTPAWVEVDVFFKQYGLVIEVDGGPWHKTKFRQELDAYKQKIVEDAGYRVIRFTDKDPKPAREAQTAARIWRELPTRCR